VYGPRLAERGIALNRVPLADTADAVNAVLGELEAGRTSGGSIDLVWINGENFATMRQADALRSGWSQRLPNATLVDWDDPAVAFDAGVPVDGAESPWGSAQFQFVHDTARTDEADLPRSYAELADWIEENPGRFTYPARRRSTAPGSSSSGSTSWPVARSRGSKGSTRRTTARPPRRCGTCSTSCAPTCGAAGRPTPTTSPTSTGCSPTARWI
jgi:hypothetical protein